MTSMEMDNTMELRYNTDQDFMSNTTAYGAESKVYAPTEGQHIDEYQLARHKHSFYAGPNITEHFERDITACGFCDKMTCCDKIWYYMCCCYCIFCCEPQKTKIGVRPGYGLVVTVMDDIYAASLGPAKISLCCTNKKQLYWVNTGERTIELKNFPVVDKDNKEIMATILIIYRITDIVNYVFNLYQNKPTSSITLFENTLFAFQDVMRAWGEGAKLQEIERCMKANLKAVLWKTFKGTADELRQTGIPKESFVMLNNRVKYLGITIHDLSIQKLKVKNSKDAMIGTGTGGAGSGMSYAISASSGHAASSGSGIFGGMFGGSKSSKHYGGDEEGEEEDTTVQIGRDEPTFM